MTSTDLKFDEQVIDTSLAKEYLKQNLNYHSKGFDDNGDIVYDSYKSKIYISKYVQLPSNCIYQKVDLSKNFLDLSEKIIKNTDLFCQLEYLLRKKPLEQVKNNDVKLLVQNLLYHSSFQEAEQACISEIIMTADTPLASLGCIAQTMLPKVVIISTKETAVICSLFVELCHEAGIRIVTRFARNMYRLTSPAQKIQYQPPVHVLCSHYIAGHRHHIENKHVDFNQQKLQDIVYLLLVSDPPASGLQTVYLSEIKDMANGCVGIVTEKADVDSAVDTFLYSTNQYPWHIKKIFVQECVLNRFKKSIEWKTKKPSGDVQEHLLKSCSSVHVYEDKCFLFEFAGNIKNINQNSIIIEAYRTNKEIISLMSTIKPFSVSLWSSNVAESNEITYGLDANIVWINDFACFEGPPIASQSFYSLIHRYLDSKKEKEFPETAKVLKIRETWLKLDIATRYMKIQKIWAKLQSDNEKCDLKLKYNLNSTMSVGNKVCIVTRHPDKPLIKVISEPKQISDYLNYIVDGGAVIFVLRCPSSDIDEILKYYNNLVDVNAPVALIRDEECNIDNLPYSSLWYKTKGIWTSIGTIFAN